MPPELVEGEKAHRAAQGEAGKRRIEVGEVVDGRHVGALRDLRPVLDRVGPQRRQDASGRPAQPPEEPAEPAELTDPCQGW